MKYIENKVRQLNNRNKIHGIGLYDFIIQQFWVKQPLPFALFFVLFSLSIWFVLVTLFIYPQLWISLNWSHFHSDLKQYDDSNEKTFWKLFPTMCEHVSEMKCMYKAWIDTVWKQTLIEE
jgi:hypothetical protein